MFNNLEIVAVIPARGGSKGIPGKNIMDFCGKPLLAWTLLQAKAAKTIKHVYVSSDDEQILDISVLYGAKAISRPKELATDTATSESALLHVLDNIERESKSIPDLIVFLQATSPLREPDDIDNAVRKIIEDKADSLFSMSVLDDFCIWSIQDNNLKGLTFDPYNRGRRQDRQPLYLENGSIYIFKPDILRKCNNRLGGAITMYEMEGWKSYEIDRKEDLDIFEYFFKKYLLEKWAPKKAFNYIDTKEIDLIAYDLDGVMTDNLVILSQDGGESAVFNRADGLAVDIIRARRIPQIIISTETNPIVKMRANKLRLAVIDSCADKKLSLIEYCKLNGYDLKKVVYVGNDVNDLDVMQSVGFPIAPSDAHPRIKTIAKFVTVAKGGEGVIREMVDHLFDYTK